MDKGDMKRLSSQLQHLMVEREIRSVAQLAEFTGVEVRQIRRIFACDTAVRLIDIFTLGHFFGLCLNWTPST